MKKLYKAKLITPEEEDKANLIEMLGVYHFHGNLSRRNSLSRESLYTIQYK